MYTAKEVLVTFNATINGYEEIYRGVARSFGLSDCAFWILYFIRQSEEKVTQKDICSFIYQSKQTVHSAFEDMDASERELAMKLLAKYSDSLSRRMSKFRQE